MTADGVPRAAERGFTPAGVVTLLTDFGSSEPFVGVMKGRILGICPGARIVDLTHDLAPFGKAQAAFWIERVRRDFPPGTVHLVIVDPGVGTSRRLIAVLLDGQVLLGPDNGVLGGVAREPAAEVRAVSGEVLAKLHPRPSSTFHGRDWFAPLAASLAGGVQDFHQVGNVIDDPVPSELRRAARVPGGWRGEVVLQDRYGNLFSNIELSPDSISEIREVRFGGHALPCVRTYGEAVPGACVALVNAFGVVEAACVEGSAAERLGLGPGDPVELEILAGDAPGAPGSGQLN